MQQPDFDTILRTAVRAAYSGGKILRRHFGNLHHVRKKGAIDLVSEADTSSEAAIIETIRSRHPDHAILAEESGASRQEHASFQWIIDPLDGTTNFVHQIPVFAVSIGVSYRGELVVGVVLNPVSGELFSAVYGEGAWRNGESIHVSSTASIQDSLLATGFPYQVPHMIDVVVPRFSRCLQAAQGIRRLGAAAMDLCYLACGRFDGFWEQNLKPWDTAAGTVIAREAGARITDFSNHPYTLASDQILVTNGRIHEDLLQLLNIEGI